jgi:CO dehydrogenase maturation factor
MGYTIALAGKGGSGKSTIAAIIIRLLKESAAGSILGIDADPNSNLADYLGLPHQPTIGRIIDEVAAHPEKIPAGMTKDRYIEYQVQTAVSEGNGFDILTMGKPEGPGCYCYANNVLRAVMGKLINSYDYVIIDNEAGLEHLSRRTTRTADILVVIAQPTAAGLRAAQRIIDLVKELAVDTKRNVLLLNNAQPDDMAAAVVKGLEIIGTIPEDKNIENISKQGTSLFLLEPDSPSMRAVMKAGRILWR